MRDEVINIENSSIADRMILSQVILDTGEVLYRSITDANYSVSANPYLREYEGKWVGFSSARKPAISIKDFVKKYGKQKGLEVENTKTSLQEDSKKHWSGTVYNEDGARVEVLKAKTEKGLNKLFRISQFRDCSMRVSKHRYTTKEYRKFINS